MNRKSAPRKSGDRPMVPGIYSGDVLVQNGALASVLEAHAARQRQEIGSYPEGCLCQSHQRDRVNEQSPAEPRGLASTASTTITAIRR